jgi:hypothetical protein
MGYSYLTLTKTGKCLQISAELLILNSMKINSVGHELLHADREMWQRLIVSTKTKSTVLHNEHKTGTG